MRRAGAQRGAGARPNPLRSLATAGAALFLAATAAEAVLVCPAQPQAGCKTSRWAKLVVKDKPGTTKGDRLVWQWRKGDVTDTADLGDPTAATEYALCVYDHAAGSSSLVASFSIPAGADWEPRSDGGFRYRDPTGSQGGARKLVLVPDSRGKAKIKFTAKGDNLVLPGPVAPDRYFDQDGAVTVQLHNSDGTCWTAGFLAPHTADNGAERFKAKISGRQPNVYVVLHIDPNRSNDTNFNRLANLMAMLDERRAKGFDHRLTLLFTPEWVPFIVPDPARRSAVAQWRAAGHELGLHRHTPGHLNPDGFAELPGFRCKARCCKYRSSCDTTMCSHQDATDLVRSMVEAPDIGGVLRTAGVGPLEADVEELEECPGRTTGSALSFRNELTGDLDFATRAYPAKTDECGWWTTDGSGAPDKVDPNAVLGRVDCFAPPDYPNARPAGAKSIPHAQFYNEQNRVYELPLEAVTAALGEGGRRDYIGIVWHEDGFPELGSCPASPDPASPPSCSGSPPACADGKTAEECTRHRVCALFDAFEQAGVVSRTVSEVLVTADCD